MPVEFTHGPLGQVLLRRRDVMALRQVLDDLLAQPSSREQTGLRVREPPLQVWHNAVIGFLGAEVTGVIFIDVLIRSTCG